MDQTLARRIIESQVDVITPASKVDAQLYKHATCPICGHQGADKVLLPTKIVSGEDGSPQVLRSPFSSESPIPQGTARCKSCNTEYQPMTGIIVKTDVPMVTDLPDIKTAPR
jgi:transcription elongation factor Elf1